MRFDPFNVTTVNSVELDIKTCSICYTDVLKDQRIKLNCGHEFCQTCVHSHVKNFMENNLNTVLPCCPNYYCKKLFSNAELQSYAHPDDYIRYQKFIQGVKVVTDRSTRYCPTPDCESIVELSHFGISKVDCPKCQKPFCKDCGF